LKKGGTLDLHRFQEKLHRANGNEAVEAMVQIGSRFAGADPMVMTELNLSARAYE
jgi:hypothetical protein